ncbi:MAG: nitroreductase [Hyphomonadaceae bacterium]
MPIRPDLPAQPELGAPVAAPHESPDTLRLLALRRSTPVAILGDPGPPQEDLDALLRLALRAPDHRKLEPWRVLVFEGEARNDLGDIFAEAQLACAPDTDADSLAAARMLALRTPVVVAVISSPVDDPKQTPVWEQELSAGAVCQNLLIAANAAGWGAVWLTEWPAFDVNVARALGLSERERFAGFIHIGTPQQAPLERQRPDLANKVRRWRGRS